MANAGTERAAVFVVDDDAGARNSLRWLLEFLGFEVATFAGARDFINGFQPTRPGCLILDLRMPGMGGLELQEWLTAHGIVMPVIIVTGHGDVPVAVRAMKAGAFDFIQKPYNARALIDTTLRAIRLDGERRSRQARSVEIVRRYALLRPREKQVAAMLYRGYPNKRIASELQLSLKTVEAYRGRAMEKMQASSAIELVQIMREGEVVVPES